MVLVKVIQLVDNIQHMAVLEKQQLLIQIVFLILVNFVSLVKDC